MSFDRIADQKIRQALAEGTLKTPSGRGQVDLNDYFSVSEDLRMAYGLLKSANCVPEEVEYLKEVNRLREALAAAADENARQPIRKQLADAELRLNLALERARRR